MIKTNNKNILVAPLNWGMGHATRCIPIINTLLSHGFTPILASDGIALELLKIEFPALIALELPSYKIEYPKNGTFFKLKMIANSPKMINAILAEKKVVKAIITAYNIVGIISDNRFGVRSKDVPSVFITHQLNVMTGNTTWLSSKMHLYIIKKFTECWVPDVETIPNLSGDLGHLKKHCKTIKYIGPLSRVEQQKLLIKFDLMVILSGPEPQRTFLEEKLALELIKYKGRIIFIRGKLAAKQEIEIRNHITFYNFMNTNDLQTAFNESDLILCRSGYTTVMDLAKIEKKAFFIPTPGQYEQEYLAKKFKKEGLVNYCKQENFNIDKLLDANLYKGLENLNTTISWKDLFSIFPE